MRYKQVKQSIISQFSQSRKDANKTVIFIMGQPGGGKSACARDALKELGYTAENTVEFVASLRDPVDVLGTPNNEGDFTRWVPPEEFYKLRQGKCALLLEELSDAPVAMQNALCGVIYDRRAGNFQLSDQLVIIATGNRTEDKSGANRITSKLAGRTRRIDFTENLDDLVEYAQQADWPTELIQFLRFRPALVADFQADRFANPTPRTWEDVARMPADFPADIEHMNVAGSVGDGAATEYLGFKKIYMNLPDMAEVIKAPKTAVVPPASQLAVRFAMMGALAERADKGNIANIVTYIERFPVEFNVMCMQDIVRRDRSLASSKTFLDWAVQHNDVLQ